MRALPPLLHAIAAAEGKAEACFVDCVSADQPGSSCGCKFSLAECNTRNGRGRTIKHGPQARCSESALIKLFQLKEAKMHAPAVQHLLTRYPSVAAEALK
jgi:predicted small secreted protein